jgi:AcrR family transcriptional regulator
MGASPRVVDNDGERHRDPVRTRAEILAAAAHEFADLGYAAARVGEIAARTRTTKRMLYYYFGGKEQLYVAVLERGYAEIRAAQQQADVEGLDPVPAIRRLAEVTFDHHEEHPDFIRLVNIENIHRARHIARSETLAELGTPVTGILDRILARGHAAGVFRTDVDALDVHLVISSFCFFQVANRYTFGAVFGRDLTDPAVRGRYRRMLGDLVVSYLTAV